MYQYIPIFVLIIAAFGIGFLMNTLARWAGPFRPASIKNSLYESGMDPVGSAHDKFSVKFYLVAMLFILFDIEIVFMYPWAVQFKELTREFGALPIVEMGTFVVILFVGYLYIYKKGGLRWDD